MSTPHISRLPLRRNSRSRAHLLLVAVNPIWRRGLTRILRHRYHVYPAEGAQPAIRLAAKQPPDVVLLDADDLELPLVLIRELRGLPRMGSVPILVVAALATRESVVEAVAAGATDYLLKEQMPSGTLYRRIDGSLLDLDSELTLIRGAETRQARPDTRPPARSSY